MYIGLFSVQGAGAFLYKPPFIPKRKCLGSKKSNDGAKLQYQSAATNFLNALEKIPGIISQRKEKNEALVKYIPQLQELARKVWKKEDELKQLKSELSALDRKIQLELAPPTPVSEEQEKKQDLDTFKLETIHAVNPNKDFIYIRPENGYNKGRKIQNNGGYSNEWSP